MHSKNSPNAPKNTAQESSKKTITDIHQQSSQETDDTVEDTTYKMPPPGHVDESESDDEVLVKRIKNIKQGIKSRPKKIQLRVIELPWDLCKWLVDSFDPYSVTLYISLDKRIEITPMDVHITLALPIGGWKVEEFYEKRPKDAKYNEVLNAWRKD
ncbi:hypothetical protein Cgig2_007088 [Carnegiea gigantea]|uniref:Uncharacterized protein n=1 Tax=Carnegiea gigantea TaxID=171969 RepID=A0A9Q1JSA3_9CARY|nr:hypothetical protein Cgig2_007088 [Carnegiea gigantea]